MEIFVEVFFTLIVLNLIGGGLWAAYEALEVRGHLALSTLVWSLPVCGLTLWLAPQALIVPVLIGGGFVLTGYLDGRAAKRVNRR